MVAIRAGLAARQDAVSILHELGATDGDIANRYALRTALLCLGGALVGVALCLPLLAAFAQLAAPLLGQMPRLRGLQLPWQSLPWPPLAALPPAVALIAWLAAQGSVRGWLKRLP